MEEHAVAGDFGVDGVEDEETELAVDDKPGKPGDGPASEVETEMARTRCTKFKGEGRGEPEGESCESLHVTELIWASEDSDMLNMMMNDF